MPHPPHPCTLGWAGLLAPTLLDSTACLSHLLQPFLTGFGKLASLWVRARIGGLGEGL